MLYTTGKMKFSIISYGDFFDIPRMIYCKSGEAVYEFVCEFSHDRDNYSDTYRVFLLNVLAEDFENHNYGILRKKHIAEVPVADMKFDKTRRKSFEVENFMGRAE